jgi:hypothetical protein
MICCKARYILTESATAVRNTFMCQSYPKQAPNGLLSPALSPIGRRRRRRRRQKECTDLCPTRIVIIRYTDHSPNDHTLNDQSLYDQSLNDHSPDDQYPYFTECDQSANVTILRTTILRMGPILENMSCKKCVITLLL